MIDGHFQYLHWADAYLSTICDEEKSLSLPGMHMVE